MNADIFLDEILKKYEGSFDIERSYQYHGSVFDAYARFSSASEKYVLTKSAALWRTESFEHVLFDKFGGSEVLDQRRLFEIKMLMEEHMEPEMVREGKKYPKEDHMMTFLSYTAICERRVSPELIELIKKFKFEKSYLFTFRGRCEAHIIVADLEAKKIYTNRYAGYMSEIFEPILK